MQVFQTLEDIPSEAKGSVIAIGNFDGVHRGHQSLLKKAADIAAEKKVALSVLTFEPHPRRLFRPDDPPSRITPADLKHWRFQEFGVENVFSLPFDWDFASQSAEDFIRNILIDGLDAAHVVVGYDFQFGQLRQGSAKDIESAGISVSILDEVADEDDGTISSSEVRQALRHGEIDKANDILGWDWEIRGEIVKGDQRGRELGYPTANVNIGETVHPAYGVYATLVQIEGEDKWRPAATNIGIRPMFEIPTAQVESFIFDFDKEIYGKILRVKPVQRLRSEAKFNSLDELIEQMGKDCEQAREILSV